MRVLLFCGLTIVAAVSGCATDPDLIPAMQVSRAPYAAMTCAQLESGISASIEQLRTDMESQQERSRNHSQIAWLSVLGSIAAYGAIDSDTDNMNNAEEEEISDEDAYLALLSIMGLGYLFFGAGDDQIHVTDIARAKGEVQAQRLEFERCR